jgi:hypothetical protein
METAKLDKALTQLDTEQARVLEAHRLGVLTPQLLGEELTHIDLRRQALQQRRNHLTDSTQSSFAVKDAAKDMRSFCQLVVRGLDSMHPSEQRQLLRHLIVRIIIESESRILIKCKIPMNPAGDRFASVTHFPIVPPVATKSGTLETAIVNDEATADSHRRSSDIPDGNIAYASIGGPMHSFGRIADHGMHSAVRNTGSIGDRATNSPIRNTANEPRIDGFRIVSLNGGTQAEFDITTNVVKDEEWWLRQPRGDGGRYITRHAA